MTRTRLAHGCFAAVAAALLLGSAQDAGASFYYRELAPSWNDSTSGVGARGLNVTAEMDFSISSIGVRAKVQTPESFELLIFEVDNPGTVDDPNDQLLFSTTALFGPDTDFNWYSFEFEELFSFVEGQNYVVHWRTTDGSDLPSDSRYQLDPFGGYGQNTLEYPEVTVERGVSGYNAESENFFIPIFRLGIIPEPTTASLFVLAGGTLLARRRRITA